MMSSRPTPPPWQILTRSELDAAYDNTRAVADSSEQLAGFEERSAGLSLRYPDHLDLRYGPRERQRIDYFSTGKSHSSVHPRRVLADAAEGDLPFSGIGPASSRH